MKAELCPTCIKRLLIAKQKGYGREKTKNLMCSLECARILEEQEKSGDARSVAGKVIEKFRGEQ